jgi:hypothetical protein
MGRRATVNYRSYKLHGADTQRWTEKVVRAEIRYGILALRRRDRVAQKETQDATVGRECSDAVLLTSVGKPPSRVFPAQSVIPFASPPGGTAKTVAHIDRVGLFWRSA